MLPFALLALLLAGLTPLANLAAAKRLAGLENHFLVLQRNGQVFAVGRNDQGQLGLNTTTHALSPQPMLFVFNVTDVSAGVSHSCVLDQDKVKCTGANYFYQLGDGTRTNKPVLAPALGHSSGIEEVQCGLVGSCAKTASGIAQCWGQFASMVGTSPVNITVSGGIESLSLAQYHACFLAVGGKLYCMGRNDYGQLGTGNKTFQAAPAPVVGLAAEGIVSVACGYDHTCAVNADGAMLCWGRGNYGQLGNLSVILDSPVPIQASGIASGAASAWVGFHNSFALMQDGSVWAFGRYDYGLFGTGSIDGQTASTVFGQGVSGVVEVRGGSLTTCVLLQNDAVWCTGYNGFGQLGVNSTTDSLTLVEMHLRATSSPTISTVATPAPSSVIATSSPTSSAASLPASLVVVAVGAVALLLC